MTSGLQQQGGVGLVFLIQNGFVQLGRLPASESGHVPSGTMQLPLPLVGIVNTAACAYKISELVLRERKRGREGVCVRV